MTEPTLLLIPESFGFAALEKRLVSIERLRNSRIDSAAQLCRRSENIRPLGIVLRRTSNSGSNQLTWRWRATGEKCINIAAVIDAAATPDAENILQLDAERRELNYELSVYGSELMRLRRTNRLLRFQI